MRSRDGTSGLADVLVLIENEHTIKTDSLGRFSFEINENQLKDKYNLRFQKEGYKPLNEYYYPNSSKEFRLQNQ